jgi:hypothetical protein
MAFNSNKLPLKGNKIIEYLENPLKPVISSWETEESAFIKILLNPNINISLSFRNKTRKIEMQAFCLDKKKLKSF